MTWVSNGTTQDGKRKSVKRSDNSYFALQNLGSATGRKQLRGALLLTRAYAAGACLFAKSSTSISKVS